MRKTSRVMARTSLVFRRMAQASSSVAGLAVLLELVVQGLQAYAQNLRGAGLVLPGGLEGAQNQQPLHLIHGRAHAHLDHAGIECLRGPSLRLAEGRGRCPASSGAPSAQRTTARSIVLRNSRALPGQS